MKLRFRTGTVLCLLSLVSGYSAAQDSTCRAGYIWSKKYGQCVREPDGGWKASVSEQRPPSEKIPRPHPIRECPTGQVLTDNKCVDPAK